MINNIIFYNQYHNGDCFVGKGWVRNIMQQLPDIKFSYAHKNHPDIIKDIGCDHVTSESFGKFHQLDRMVRIAQDDDTLYINTWCSAFQGELFGHHQHSNYIIQHRMYEMYCEQLTNILGRPVTQSSNPHDYLPEIDFNQYNVEGALDFLTLAGRINLFCNGPANSGQSGIGDMRFTIDYLCREFPQETFVATHDVGLKHDNLHYTSNIFNLESDLNQIAFLSQRASLIVGKNSGPYSYCQFKRNMERDDVTFFCFGKLLTDCLNAGLQFPAQFKFCDQTNDRLITNILVRELSEKTSRRTGMQHIMV